MRRAAALLLCAACAAPPPPAGPARRIEIEREERAAPSAPAGRVRAVCDEAALPTIVRLIDDAREEVEIVVFEGTAFDGDPTREIAEAVRRAVGRGVRVRMLLDDAPASNRALADLFRGARATVSFDGEGVRTHSKMVVVDRRTALVGSTNWSASALRWNHEANVLIENPALAAHLDDYVEALHDSPDRRWTVAGPDAPEATALADAAVAAALRRVLRGARRRIDAIVHAVSPDRDDAEGPVADVVDAAGRGVRCRVLLERTDRAEADFVNENNRSAAARLRAAGVEVRWDDPRRTTHAKVVIADSAALVSSANWTASSLRDGHEVGALVRDEAALAAFERYFEGLWAEASE